MTKHSISRREFIKTSAVAVGAVSLLPTRLPAAPDARLGHPYDDNTVVRVYDPHVFDGTIKQPWDTADNNFYWRRFDQEKLRGMLELAVIHITGAANAADAWKLLLPKVSSTSRIAVKANMNNTDVPRFQHDWMRRLLTTPPMINALAASLGSAGVPAGNITVFDCSRAFPDEFRKDIASGVKVLGRGQNNFSAQRIPLSDKPGFALSVPSCVAEADYLITLNLIKNHSGGVTGCLKNFFGMAENVGAFAHNPSWDSHHQQRDIILNPAIKSKFGLSICEATFTSLHGHPDFLDLFSRTDFFPDGKMSSLVVSRSPFHHDAALYDFMNLELTGKLDRTIGSDGWLHNCSNQGGGHPTWREQVLGGGRIVDAGGALPPKDLAYDPALLRYMSVA